MPAGTQFSSASRKLPDAVGTVTTVFAGKTLFFGAGGGGKEWPTVATNDNGTWGIQPIDDGRGYADPRPPSTRGGFAATAAAAIDSRVVIVGAGSSFPGRSRPALPVTYLPMIWSSGDGLNYQRFDPAKILGGTDGVSIHLKDVRASGAGFIAVGDLARANGKKSSALVVLGSADGLAWSLLATIEATWSLRAESIHTLGAGRLVLYGREFACDATGYSQSYDPGGGTVRLWQSADSGSTWQPVDLAGADPVLHTPEPVPADAAACNGLGMQALDKRFKTSGKVLGVVDDHVVAVSGDGSQAASTADLSAWSLADLAGGARLADADGGDPQQPAASLLTAGPDGWVLRSLERRKDDTGRQLKAGCQSYWWRSVDQRVSWTAGVLGRPMATCDGAFYTLSEVAGGAVILFIITPDVTDAFKPPRNYRESAKAPLVEWGSCVPGPQADCEFVTLAGAGGESVDWRGIDLIGATLSDVKLSRALLGGAAMQGATISGDLSDADLKDALLFNVTLNGDLTGADFRRSNVSRSTFDGDFHLADFTGLYVFLTTFHGDLTGMKVKGATFTSTTFLPGTTCPDGKPASNADGAAACRL
jgi:hypothetical protein